MTDATSEAPEYTPTIIDAVAALIYQATPASALIPWASLNERGHDELRAHAERVHALYAAHDAEVIAERHKTQQVGVTDAKVEAAARAIDEHDVISQTWDDESGERVWLDCKCGEVVNAETDDAVWRKMREHQARIALEAARKAVEG